MDPLSSVIDRPLALGTRKVRIADIPRLFAEEDEPAPRRPQGLWSRLAAALRGHIAARGGPDSQPQLRPVLIGARSIAGGARIV